MSNYKVVKVKLPDIRTSYKSGRTDYSLNHIKEGNKSVIRKIKADYGTLINFWGQVFVVPDGVIIGFIATESGGRMLPPNIFKATGLMQVTPNALWESAKKWKLVVKSDLPSAAVSELNKKVPTLLSSKKAAPSAEESNLILKLLEKDANFNIMSGTLIIRWLLERFSTTETGGQLNKAMVAYNAGAYLKVLNEKGSKPITAPMDSTALATSPRVPAESRGYLYKMLGKDGFLSLIYIEKAI